MAGRRPPRLPLCAPLGAHTPLCASHAHQQVIDLTMMSPQQMVLAAAPPQPPLGAANDEVRGMGGG